MYTSAYDEEGNPRDNFALADLFGADLATKPPLPETKPQMFYQAWIDPAMAARDPRLVEYAKTMEEGKRPLGTLKGNALAVKPRAGAAGLGQRPADEGKGDRALRNREHGGQGPRLLPSAPASTKPTSPIHPPTNGSCSRKRSSGRQALPPRSP